jgi:hypothetical protein
MTTMAMNDVRWNGEVHSAAMQRMLRILEQPHETFSGCVDTLMRAMREEFPALTVEGSPALRLLPTLGPGDVRYLIQEYSVFSNAAIHMFLEARIRNRWPALTREIVRNMDEEMGVLTGGVPHLELMRHGYRVELGIETEDILPSVTTRGFVDRLTRLFRVPDNLFLAGVLLAFEGTAVDEFQIVEALLRGYGEHIDVRIGPQDLTGVYVAGHVAPCGSEPGSNPEDAHFQGMIDAIENEVGTADLRALKRGFLGVCLELSRWWEQLAVDTLSGRIRREVLGPPSPPAGTYEELRARCLPI